ncbi:hypothetical protein N836_01060 [Leptolyngbya sp. Heron Island J]|uniref:hypothetical protein n=1 Tax=Leptolyngbya sp. Heron Island J TaxID=1385935 RepID=UPI0003B9B150|nr:hypothetical protein [Leptolyngbya sp. Heron Island J]ESA36498.1 hypothetical protein N836_01060 [Leptolyngbya sp. Heron Island J]
MARPKRSSRTLDKAQRRLAGMLSINTKLELSNGLTVQTYGNNIDDLRQKISAYNTALSNLDALHNQMLEAERELAAYSEQMLLGLAVKFGKDSDEYEMAGGVKKSDRKRPNRRTTVAV